jgi:hypothetical protein
MDLPVPRLVALLLRAGVGARFTAAGHSMTPAIRTGDRLTVEPLGAAAPRLGEVVAGESGGRLVVHRLVGWDHGRAVLRGDCGPMSDPPVAPEGLLGRVVRIERDDREVRFGLGSGRMPMAWLTRLGLLRASAALREGFRRFGPCPVRPY